MAAAAAVVEATYGRPYGGYGGVGVGTGVSTDWKGQVKGAGERVGGYLCGERIGRGE